MGISGGMRLPVFPEARLPVCSDPLWYAASYLCASCPYGQFCAGGHLRQCGRGRLFRLGANRIDSNFDRGTGPAHVRAALATLDARPSQNLAALYLTEGIDS